MNIDRKLNVIMVTLLSILGLTICLAALQSHRLTVVELRLNETQMTLSDLKEVTTEVTQTLVRHLEVEISEAEDSKFTVDFRVDTIRNLMALQHQMSAVNQTLRRIDTLYGSYRPLHSYTPPTLKRPPPEPSTPGVAPLP